MRDEVDRGSTSVGYERVNVLAVCRAEFVFLGTHLALFRCEIATPRRLLLFFFLYTQRKWNVETGSVLLAFELGLRTWL